MKSRSALHFVLIIGIANFFADFTYEGARGIIGPFLGSLGASAAIVGFVAGLGELMGYGLRSVSGYFADKSHRHWTFAFVGYAINMFAVPALALTGRWPLAASSGRFRAHRARHSQTNCGSNALVRRQIDRRWLGIWIERSTRSGRRDNRTVAHGIGSLSRWRISNRFWYPAHSRHCFVLGLWCWRGFFTPALTSWRKALTHAFATTNLTRAYWIYLAAGALLAAGFADFALIGFHFQKANVMPGNLIPVFYAVAMAASALASIPLGRLFDRFGPIRVVVCLCNFRRCCAVCFSRHIGICIDWNDFLGNRNERAGFALSSDANWRYSTTETKHSFWLV